MTAPSPRARPTRPIDAVAAGLRRRGRPAGDRRESRPRQRQAVIAANAELQERELIKLASLAAALADALRGRGVAEPAASLAAEAGIAVFRVAFERWVADDNRRDLPELVGESLDELRALSGAQRQGDEPPIRTHRAAAVD